MTVNVTCHLCDGRQLCDACRSAARTLGAAGHRVEHSTRYDALRAAASGTYGFDACIVPVTERDRAIADAASILFAGKRLAIVLDSGCPPPDGLPPHVTLLTRERYSTGTFDVAWLREGQTAAPRDATGGDDETSGALDTSGAAADRAHATRRLKGVADRTRNEIARAALPVMPRLDMLAVLEDEIAWAHASGIGFGIVLAHLPGLTAAEDVGAAIAGAVRAADVIAGRGDDFLVVVAEAGPDGVRLAADRIASAVGSIPASKVPKPRRARGFAAWSVGCASYPKDGSTRDALLARVTATLAPMGSRRP
ncbi:MAG TPA: hypothetical protein VKU81_05490 [Casimicrobiaceae bacterium]|nr:hypothetical protein [Casimicrobiaceae bacterium]